MIDAAALHRAADRLWDEANTAAMDQLAAAGAQFIAETDLTARGAEPDFIVQLDPATLGYGIMLGYLAAEEGRDAA